MMSNRAPAHDDLLHAHNHDWPSGVPRNEPHEHPHTGPGHAGFTHLHPHLHAPAGSVPAPGAPQCEADGVRNGPDGPGGTEFYWSCTAPGTVDVDGILMCDDHAGERGYGPKQEDYGYDRGVT